MKGKIIIIAPGQPATTVEHVGKVDLEDLHRLLEVDCVATTSLGNPPGMRTTDVWYDDEGLLKADVVDEHGKYTSRGNLPNRRIGPKTVIFGRMLICASDEGGDSWPLTDEEAAVCLQLVEKRWAMLPADLPRPEPRFEVSEWP